MNKNTFLSIIKSSVVKGTIILTIAGFITRIIGFFFRIFLTDKIGAEGLGIYQFFRVTFTYLLIFTLERYNYPITPVIAVIGSLIGEIASSFYCAINIYSMLNKTYLFKNRIEQKKLTNNYEISYKFKNCYKKITLEILKLSLPLTLNKLMLSILQSIQSILIPSMLIIYGCTSSKALSLYGITLGLVLPLVMFPSAIVNSMSLLILPTISEADSNKNVSKVKLTLEKAITFSSIFGILCFGIFARYGKEISLLIFHSDYGKYICILGAICPFTYITATIGSTINGLGYTEITFRHNIVMALIQIISIVFFVPKYGIIGYISGLLLSSAVGSILHYISIKHLVKFNLNRRKVFIYPFMYVFLLIKSCDSIFIQLLHTENIYTFLTSSIIVCITYILLYLKNI